MSFSATSATLKAYESELGYKLPASMPQARRAGQLSLYGGRRENYFVGDTRQLLEQKGGSAGRGGILVCFDFKSQYAHLLSEGSFPDVRRVEMSQGKPTANHFVAQADVEVSALHGVPPLPFHSGKGVNRNPFGPRPNQLIFPSGRFSGFWNEVDLSYPQVKILAMKRVWNFPAPPFNFASFIRRFIPHGENEIARAIQKNIYTSFSGKFSQSNQRTLLLGADSPKLTAEDYRTGVFFGEWVLVNRTTPWPRSSNFLWTSYCNAYGRKQQFQLYAEIASQSGKVLHGNTDSAIALMPSLYGARRVLNAFGKKLKSSFLDWARFLAPGCYIYQKADGLMEVVASGIPRKVQGQLVDEQHEVYAEVPDSFMQLLRSAAVGDEIKNRWSLKKFSLFQARKLGRIVGPDGWTDPYALPLS